MNLIQNKTFCSLPWVNVSVDPDGSVKPCCVSTDYIKKDDGTRFNLGFDSIDDIINSTSIKNIRDSMLRGESITGCTQCYAQEKSNGKSQRIIHNEKWLKLSLEKIKKASNTIEDVQYLDLRFGNLCNLACRSCFPGYSSQVAKDVEEVAGLQKFHPILTVDTNQWYHTDMFKMNIEKQSDNITQLYVTGGEPTIIKQNYDYLTSLIDTGKSSKISLLINTNMTNLRTEWVNILSAFKDVTLMASIDGVTQTQEYIRYPSNWKQIDKNFLKLVNNKPANLNIVVTPVIQAYNIGSITTLFDYFEDFNRTQSKRIVSILPIVLESPSYLSLEILPKEYKLKCMSKLREWITQSCKFQSPTFHQRVNSIYAKCNSSGNPTALNEFIEFTEICDKHRNQSLKDVDTELWEICNANPN